VLCIFSSETALGSVAFSQQGKTRNFLTTAMDTYPLRIIYMFKVELPSLHFPQAETVIGNRKMELRAFFLFVLGGHLGNKGYIDTCDLSTLVTLSGCASEHCKYFIHPL